MENYYVNRNAQDNGDHEVHVDTCYYFSSMNNKEYLGVFTGCEGAVIEAKKRGYNANGCKFCCTRCHTT